MGFEQSCGIRSQRTLVLLQKASPFKRKKTDVPTPSVFAASWNLGHLRAPGRIRTCDQEIRRLLLYPLSYGGDLSIILRSGPNSSTRDPCPAATWLQRRWAGTTKAPQTNIFAAAASKPGPPEVEGV